ncbi:MAG: hypothetical protein HY712_00005 [candidate division NC10 bacterium]|nr:hypothetical protein [candidate division NC10 bacterium]
MSRIDTYSFWSALQHLSSESRRTAQPWSWFAGLFRHLLHPAEDPTVRRLLGERLEQARKAHITVVRRGQEVGCIRREVPEDLLVTLLFEFGMVFRQEG